MQRVGGPELVAFYIFEIIQTYLSYNRVDARKEECRKTTSQEELISCGINSTQSSSLRIR
jgi:hypothetical protein